MEIFTGGREMSKILNGLVRFFEKEAEIRRDYYVRLYNYKPVTSGEIASHKPDETE
jgi:hypothetical protein